MISVPHDRQLVELCEALADRRRGRRRRHARSGTRCSTTRSLHGSGACGRSPSAPPTRTATSRPGTTPTRTFPSASTPPPSAAPPTSSSPSSRLIDRDAGRTAGTAATAAAGGLHRRARVRIRSWRRAPSREEPEPEILWAPVGRDGRALPADPLHALARGRARAPLRGLPRALALVGRPRSRSSGGRSGTTSRSWPPARPTRARGPSPMSSSSERVMPGADWFPGAELNYAEHIFRGKADDEVAIVYASELRELVELRWGELREQVAAVAGGPARARRRRAATASSPTCPNIPETVIAFLATASLGAIWSSCSPDFGPAQRRRPLRADRAEGAVLRRRLPLRRQGLRPARDDRRDRRSRSRASSGSSSSPT